MIVAVTGGTGFVGRHLIGALAGEAGVSVRALSRRPAPDIEAAGAAVVRGGLEDEAALSRLTDGARAVVHCAGIVSAPRPADYERANAGGTAAVLRAADPAARFVHVSSLAAREPGLSAYAASKRRGEQLVAEAGRTDAVVVRPPAVYGPGDRATLPIFQQLRRGLLIAPARRAARFSLIFVADLARLLARLALGAFRSDRPVEPDDGRAGGYGWEDLAAIAGKASGRRIRTLYLPTRLLWPVALGAEAWSRIVDRPPPLSRDKLRELGHSDWVCGPLPAGLGWRPSTGFAEGHAETAAWYERAGWL
ncbi:MAG TPA: NAD-dependent epimerase/dehydratase family protein [Geminicoccaceae bacterium]|nr:NAD-dependent epimerase/dehydratase family protein [Geminicoccus sp.]HMU51211.1 NAD-dependent epimerase/dehydratase family protein [Geminicoccaceae bacterium]